MLGTAMSLSLLLSMPAIVEQLDMTPPVVISDTAIIYRGQLAFAGIPVDANVDLEFRLYSDMIAGEQIGQSLFADGVWLSDGQFTLELDFGVDLAAGAEYWIETTVDGMTIWPRESTSPMPSPFAGLPSAAHGSSGSTEGSEEGEPKAIASRPPIVRTASPQHAAPASIIAGHGGQAAFAADPNTGPVVGADDPDAVDRGGGTARAGSWMLNGTSIYYVGGNVGIGLANPLYPLHVQSSGTFATFSYNTAAGGVVSGMEGRTRSPAGRGISGSAIATTGSSSGVFGKSNGAAGRGGQFLAASESGVNYGVYSQTNSPAGYAFYGMGPRNYLQGKLGIGKPTPTYQLDVDGTANVSVIRLDGQLLDISAGPGGTVGIGISSPTARLDVRTTSGKAIYASTSDAEVAISALATDDAATGMYGYNSSSTGTTVGVYGRVASNNQNAIAVYGVAANANAYAGYFYGDVRVAGTLYKDANLFSIDHPLDPANKFLQHSVVESPDMMNIYNGNVITDETGTAWVELPEYFDALNMDFRYQLTVIGEFAQAIVGDEIQNRRFSIRTDRPLVKVSWQVTGIRKDPWAMQHRVQVEVDKLGSERGRYVHPELYGQPREKAMDYRPGEPALPGQAEPEQRPN